jgi:formylglycine-generating enzyme required for sulfatase activity
VAHAHTLLRCLGLTLCETGRPALIGEVPFGQALGDIARDALERAATELSAADIRMALQQLAGAESAAYSDLLRQSSTSIAGGDATLRDALRDYLRYWPSSIRQILRRPSDSSGRAMPAGLAFDDPIDLLRFLPARPPRFYPGRLSGMEEWELTRFCGLGELTEVWAARNLSGSEPSALKFVTYPPAVPLILDNEALFTRVFALAGQSGIVPLRSVCPDPDLLYLETGYAPGYDLAGLMFDWKWRWGRPMPDAALNLIRRLSDIVGKAHTRKIVHRNLKPSNVLLMPADGTRFTMWVSDFGWGQIAATLAVSRKAMSGLQHATLRGAHTLLYSAPQVAEGEPPDPRDDVYSIGMIWYQLLYQDPGEPPPTGPGWMEEFAAHGLSAAQADLLAACLAASPADRPADATALSRRLAEIGQAGNAAPASPPAPERRSTPAPAAAPEEAPTSAAGNRPLPTTATPARPKAASAVAGARVVAEQDPIGSPTPANDLGSGSFIFDTGFLSGTSGPTSIGRARPPGPLSTILPANVALGARNGSKMVMNSIGMSFVLIPAGEFMMGTSDMEPIRGAEDEQPQHRVRITRPFYLSAFPVTQAQFRKVVGRNPAYFNEARGGSPNHPVESITWDLAELFCVKLALSPEESALSRAYLLPTEAEWEYACRAGTITPFWCGDRLTPQIANFAASPGKYSKGTPGGSTFAVGQLVPNPWGLYDMHGNVQEWVQDWYDEGYYTESPVNDPPGPKASAVKVTRGGCWQSFGTDCRSAARMLRPPDRASNQIGFRVVMLANDAE